MKPSHRISKQQHAQFHLPPLNAHEALLLVRVFDRAVCAIWRAHGHAMEELLESRLDNQCLTNPKSKLKAKHRCSQEKCDNDLDSIF